MRHTYTLLLLFLLPFLPASAFADHTISGTVKNDKGLPVKGANVYLDNTIDGATTDSTGAFSFTTAETGNQTIVASEISHSAGGAPIVINGDVTNILIILKANNPRDLDVVVITAGSIDATNDKGKTVLKPLDIVTTAGSGADVVKAMQMLPGTQQTGPDNGLFVRGGDANEAAIIVDEMVVQNAFFSGAPGVATRSRFGAFQYQGVAFSSGGYSARYSQALSGVLELTTTDLPDKSTINVGANMAGVYASGVKKWKKSALDLGGGYTNLTPFYGIVKSNFNFYIVPQGGNGNIRYTWKPNKDGILKATFNTQHNNVGVTIPNFMGPGEVNFVTKDQNYYSNVSYKQMFKNKYMLYTAASVSHNQTDASAGDAFSNTTYDDRRQFRVEGKRYINSRMNLLVGSDVQNFGQRQVIKMIDTSGATMNRDLDYLETLVSAYTEYEWVPVNRFALKLGARYEHSEMMDLDKIAPRVSMALKTGSHSQASVAGGIFYQQAPNFYLIASDYVASVNNLDMQQATHYIANWQWSADNRTLRIEGYRKEYEKLVWETPVPGMPFNNNPYRFALPGMVVTNGGSGYAQGIDLFWRDKKTFKNSDYWISYSYIDTKRKYLNYLKEATPTYIAEHNLNVVGKHWIDKLKTSVNATYSFATGRPFYDANFAIDKTTPYHSLSLSAAYLRSFGKWFTVFYISVDNVAGRKNVFGYRYAPDGTKSQILPALNRTVFFGVNMSLSEFSKDEL